jgi:hypothetical protein
MVLLPVYMAGTTSGEANVSNYGWRKFNFLIFFLNTRRKFHFLISFAKGLIVIYCYIDEESELTREECFVTYNEAFVGKQSSVYIFYSLNWFIIAVKLGRIFKRKLV